MTISVNRLLNFQHFAVFEYWEILKNKIYNINALIQCSSPDFYPPQTHKQTSSSPHYQHFLLPSKIHRFILIQRRDATQCLNNSISFSINNIFSRPINVRMSGKHVPSINFLCENHFCPFFPRFTSLFVEGIQNREAKKTY